MDEDIKLRIEAVEKRNDQLFGKIEALQDAHRFLQSSMGEINMKLSQVVQAVEKLSNLTEKNIEMSTTLKNTQNDIEILFSELKEIKTGGLPLCRVHNEQLASLRRECDEKIQSYKREFEDKLLSNKNECNMEVVNIKNTQNDIWASIGKRDTALFWSVTFVIVTFVGFFMWYIQSIGGK